MAEGGGSGEHSDRRRRRSRAADPDRVRAKEGRPGRRRRRQDGAAVEGNSRAHHRAEDGAGLCSSLRVAAQEEDDGARGSGVSERGMAAHVEMRRRRRWIGVRLGLLGGRMGLRGRPSREGNGQRPGGWALSHSLIISLFQRNKSFRRNVERDWSGVWAWGLFSRTHKNALDPGKIEVA